MRSASIRTDSLSYDNADPLRQFALRRHEFLLNVG